MSEEVKNSKKPKSTLRKVIEWIAFGLFGVLFAFVLVGNIDAMVHKKENCNQELRFGVGTFVVLSESMEPRYKKNDALFTYKEKLDSVYKRYLAKKAANQPINIDMTFFNSNSGVSVYPETEEFQPTRGGTVVVTDLVMTHEVREMYCDENVPYGQGRYIIITAGINPNVDTSQKGQYQIVTEKLYLGIVQYKSMVVGHVFKFMASAIGLILMLLIPAGYLIVVSAIDIFKALKESEEREAAGITVNSGESKDVKVDTLSEEDKKRLKEELLNELLASKKGENKDGGKEN